MIINQAGDIAEGVNGAGAVYHGRVAVWVRKVPEGTGGLIAGIIVPTVIGSIGDGIAGLVSLAEEQEGIL